MATFPKIVAEFDGSRGEGGGQIIRNAIAYCTILQKPIKIINIRAGRQKPGLRAQHVTGLRLASAICGGSLEGDVVGSTSISYTPDSNKCIQQQSKETFVGDTGTAGSVCLMLQAALPCALFGSRGPCVLSLKGGTNASLAPQYDYWEHVFMPIVRKHFGILSVDAKVLCRGFYPRGGGEVSVSVGPIGDSIKPIDLTKRGDISEIFIRSYHAGKVPHHVAVDMAKVAKSVLQEEFGKDVLFREEVVTEKQAVASGSGILCVASTTNGCILAGSALGSPKKRSKQVGREAANELVSTLRDGGCVDEWLQDQLVIFMALAKGTSRILTGSLTLHTKTAIMVAEELCGAKFKITNISNTEGDCEEQGYGKNGRASGKHLIECEGIDFRDFKHLNTN